MNNRMIALDDETIIDLINTRNFKLIEENLLTILKNKEKFKHRAMISIYDDNYKKYDIGRDLTYFANNLGGILITESNKIDMESYRTSEGIIRGFYDFYPIIENIRPSIVLFNKSIQKFINKKNILILLVPGKAQQTTFTYYPEEDQG